MASLLPRQSIDAMAKPCSVSHHGVFFFTHSRIPAIEMNITSGGLTESARNAQLQSQRPLRCLCEDDVSPSWNRLVDHILERVVSGGAQHHVGFTKGANVVLCTTANSVVLR